MDALIIVDWQNDFVPGGALGVADGRAVVPLANRLMQQFDLVVATQDWHPADHVSFAVNHPGKKPGDVIEWQGISQILWPVHCVQNTPGAALVAEFDATRVNRIFYKGTDRDIDSYSAFFDNGHRRATGLGDFLKQSDVDRIYCMGLATDYCVKYSVFDARSLGFDVCVIEDGCRGVNLRSGDVDQALREMSEAGAAVTTVKELLRVM